MDINSLMKNAKKMQEKMQKIQDELADEAVEASSGGGMVTVSVNGKQEVLGIKIEPEILSSNDAKMIEDLVLAATNEALRKSQDMVKERMASLTGGMQIPGLF